MESQIQRPHALKLEEDTRSHNVGLHSALEGEEEQHRHGEKNSVMKKVKAKAKKIKETLKKHGHGQGHDTHDREHTDDTEEDDDDEEMEDEPEVHGAPIYESAAITKGEQSKFNLENPLKSGEDRYGPRTADPTTKKIRFQEPTDLDVDPDAPKGRTQASSPSNYQAKESDPTGSGGKEADVTPMLESLSIHDKSENPDSVPQRNPDNPPRDTLMGKSSEYAQKIAATVTENLAPVYGKVADAGSSVMSKIQGSSNNKGTEAGEVDRRVSVKDYVSEKFKPGDEDKALSEVISDALHNQNGKSKKLEPTGRVTESEEVAKHLGGSSEESGEDGSVKTGPGSEVVSGKAVVDRVKGAVSSWFGKGGAEVQTPPASLGTCYVGEENKLSSSENRGG